MNSPTFVKFGMNFPKKHPIGRVDANISSQLQSPVQSVAVPFVVEGALRGMVTRLFGRVQVAGYLRLEGLPNHWVEGLIHVREKS